MFHDIPHVVRDRMRYLEERDSRDRSDGTPRMQRLRQIPPDTGRFIALLAASSPAGRHLEIGTSAGYSALWLSLACRLIGAKLTTFETCVEKADLARETFQVAQVTDLVTLVQDDAREHLANLTDVAFCFLDAEKEIYVECYEAVVPKLVRGGILAADNVISHEAALRPMLDRVLADDRVDGLIVPVGKGVLVCRKL